MLYSYNTCILNSKQQIFIVHCEQLSKCVYILYYKLITFSHFHSIIVSKENKKKKIEYIKNTTGMTQIQSIGAWLSNRNYK